MSEKKLAVAVAVKVVRENAGRQWIEFFDGVGADVNYVLVDVESSEITDVTVYFKGSDEPFPLSSLREDSPVKKGVEDVLFN